MRLLPTGNVELLSLLVSAGANLEVIGAGWSPIMVAAAAHHVAAVKFLLRRGVQWEDKNLRGHGCEDIACRVAPDGELCKLFTNMRSSLEYERARLAREPGAPVHDDL